MARKRRKSTRGGGRDRLADLMLRMLIGGALRLPYRRRVSFVGWLMACVVAPAAAYARRSHDNLAFVFPEMSRTERRRIARAAADNAGRTLIENYATEDLTARMAEVAPCGPGMAALETASTAQRPVILVSGHFGNYEAARAALVARGYRIGGLYRPMKNPFVNIHYSRTMERIGGPIFAQGRHGTGGFVRHLRAGGMLVLLTDQHSRRGATLDFLGRPARTALSAAELALRYGAALVPFYATRQPDGLSFAVEIEAPVAHTDPETMMQAVNDSLAARVRAAPEQWFWPHRRWKARR